MSGTWWKDAEELIDEQLHVLELPENASFLIIGPPGSGKTNLLLLRANYLYLGTKSNLHIVVFGGVLKNFLKVGGAQYKFPPTKVVTHMSLFNEILRENKIELPDKTLDFMPSRIATALAVRKLIDEHQIGKIFDALLLDEAQDYLEIELQIFIDLSDILIAAADERQQVYDIPSPLNFLVKNIPMIQKLNFHFRNGRAICKLADGIMKGKITHESLLKSSNYDEAHYPSSVEVKGGVNITEQALAIITQAQKQKEVYPDELIGILCPRREEMKFIWEAITKSPLESFATLCGDNSFDPTKPIWVSTITSAKGLEFRAVHIAGLEYLSNYGAMQKKLAFTAVTRAKTSLTLYYDESIPGYLESAIKETTPPAEPISTARIFGKTS